MAPESTPCKLVSQIYLQHWTHSYLCMCCLPASTQQEKHQNTNSSQRRQCLAPIIPTLAGSRGSSNYRNIKGTWHRSSSHLGPQESFNFLSLTKQRQNYSKQQNQKKSPVLPAVCLLVAVKMDKFTRLRKVMGSWLDTTVKNTDDTSYHFFSHAWNLKLTVTLCPVLWIKFSPTRMFSKTTLKGKAKWEIMVKFEDTKWTKTSSSSRSLF